MIDTAVQSPNDLLLKGLRDLPRRTGCPVAFGGLVLSAGAPLLAFVGTHGTSLNGLLIEPSEGVGGLAISSRRPVAATHYRHSAKITHRYDREVTAEGIVSLLAVPVVVDDRVQAIIYTGHREATQFGDHVVGETLAAARRLAWEFSVAAEVERRLALLANTPLGSQPRAPDAPTLSPRELEMLEQLALGKRNAQIGAQLGLTEATVKSYVSSAMRKLGASSRYEAVIAARHSGLLP